MKNDFYLSSNNDYDSIDIMKSPTTQIQHSRKHKSISPPPFNFFNDDKNDNSNEGLEYNVQNCVKKKIQTKSNKCDHCAGNIFIFILYLFSLISFNFNFYTVLVFGDEMKTVKSKFYLK